MLRYICGILPLCSLFCATELWQGILLAVPAVYTAVIIFLGKLELEYFTYRQFFVRTLWLLAIGYLATSVWQFLLQRIDNNSMYLDSSVMLRYGLVHVLCGVILQRQLRLGVGARAAGSKGQMATLLGTAAVIVAGFYVTKSMLGAIIRFAWMLVLAPVVLLVETLSRGTEKIKQMDVDLGTFEKVEEEIEAGDLTIKEAMDLFPKMEAPDFDAIWLALIPLGLLLLVAMVLFAYSFYKRRATSESGAQIERVENVLKKKKTPVFSNRAKVRQLYRDFLQREQSLGMKVKRHDTSESILHRVHRSTDQPSADQLRNIYLSARYDDRDNISRDQVEQAKQALRNTHKK